MYHQRSATVRKGMEKWQVVSRSDKTCLTSYFGMTEASPQKSKLPLRFYHFFRPPQFFLKKEKANFVFCGSP
jgi:hypothetical protein